MFIDEAKIYIQAGNGGKGCVSFRREKYIPRGGPSGGDGGKGGNVILRAEKNLNTLLALKYNQHQRAEHGVSGQGSDMHGRNGEHLVVNVPVGTLVREYETKQFIVDLDEHGSEYLVAQGGIGGRGNARFKSSINQAPRFAQSGRSGEEICVWLELKLLADVGIVGYPNVGKSTLISRISSARPKIADYPFTTLVPNLGVVKGSDYSSFVVADIPGVIKGAHQGKGLGMQFLRHIERTKLLLHVLDLSPFAENDPIEAYHSFNEELANFSEKLSKKPQIVAANKIESIEAKEKFKEVKEYFQGINCPILSFSALTGEGLDQLRYSLSEKVVSRDTDE